MTETQTALSPVLSVELDGQGATRKRPVAAISGMFWWWLHRIGFFR